MMYFKRWMAENHPDGLCFVRKTNIMEVEKSLVVRKRGHVCKGSPDQPRDERGRWTSEGGGANETVTNAAGETVKVVDHINPKEKPNSITQKQNAKGGIDRNYYGTDGRQTKQISNNDHGKPKQHPFGKHGEHAHDYVWDENGNMKRSSPRELTDTESKDNGDML